MDPPHLLSHRDAPQSEEVEKISGYSYTHTHGSAAEQRCNLLVRKKWLYAILDLELTLVQS